MKKLLYVSLVYLSVFSGGAKAAVCGVEGEVQSVIPSDGVAGLFLTARSADCSCDYDAIWIDTETGGGKAMYAAALSAKMSGSRVFATIEDGLGQGAPGNSSIVYRYWATCKLKALQVF